MKSRYVITGASGHIGNNLIRYIKQVYPESEIIILTRRDISSEFEGLNIKQIIGDITNVEFLSSVIQPNDIVVHLAGYIDLENKHYDECYKVNYLSTKNIVDVCERIHVLKLVYVGSVDAIYRTGKEDVIIEPERYYPDKLKTNYAKTKAMAMQYVLDKTKENKTFNVAMIIPTAVVGVHDYKPSAVGKVIINVIRNKTEFGIKGGYNFVDVMDVCKSILLACTSDAKGQYIISGHNVTVKQMYDKLNMCLNKKKKIVIIPIWLVWLCMPFVKVLNKVTIKALRDKHNYSYTRAKKYLDYSPTPIDRTFSDVVEWFVNYYGG